jgi:[NiFe] hydrogenase assembly HybE family chaperone
MTDLETLSRQIEDAFKRIEIEQMQGIPLLNPALRVESIGFLIYRDRPLGVIITPWMMNLVLLPGEDDDWSELRVGDKLYHRLPANEYRFMVNEIEGIGICQTHSIYSPMHEFMNQDHAVAAATSFMQTLMVEVERPDQDPHDEELLGRILRGEEKVGSDIDDLATKEQKPEALESAPERLMTRRELLRGS